MNQKLLPVFRRDGVWWINASRATPDVPEWGEYQTKQEAVEARDSYLRNNQTGRELLKCSKQN